MKAAGRITGQHLACVACCPALVAHLSPSPHTPKQHHASLCHHPHTPHSAMPPPRHNPHTHITSCLSFAIPTNKSIKHHAFSYTAPRFTPVTPIHPHTHTVSYSLHRT
ncbi:hypothetical protein E2C01_036842 [Portunus trituberculatus]|uniref:Uncharacterized protein n=1 Tax=Portunus trituberculatus TaxID=210409 RepID=A0A5B7F9S7_PORTR|nr:hypothetical protein [Portunus trituberculatus]